MNANFSQDRREFLKHSAKVASVAGATLLGANSLFAKGQNEPSNTTSQIPQISLNNGVKMPVLGLGTLKIGDTKQVQKVVEEALALGYRLFDTAQSYNTEEGVGFALRATGVKREEIFITTKLFKEFATENKVQASYDRSLKALQSDYVDLFLIHRS